MQTGADVEVERVLFDRSREVGAIAISDGTTLAMSDVVADAPGGHGVVSNDGAGLTMTRFVVDGGALCGVYVTGGAALDLSDGEVRGFTIGACVQVDGYDVERLTRSVRYADNGTNLQATTLPVPEAAEAIEEAPPPPMP